MSDFTTKKKLPKWRNQRYSEQMGDREVVRLMERRGELPAGSRLAADAPAEKRSFVDKASQLAGEEADKLRKRGRRLVERMRSPFRDNDE